MSLSSGFVPETLKVAQVIPLIKTKNKKQKKPKLERNEFKNYRPISNLKFISKTIESAASAQLAKYQQENGLHGPKQSAYRKYHSTETALLWVQNDLLCAIDTHQEAVPILLDYSAAFDTIDHQILIKRLHDRYGIVGTAFSSFLHTSVDALSQLTSQVLCLIICL